jgi:hypothetical protein
MQKLAPSQHRGGSHEPGFTPVILIHLGAASAALVLAITVFLGFSHQPLLKAITSEAALQAVTEINSMLMTGDWWLAKSD